MTGSNAGEQPPPLVDDSRLREVCAEFVTGVAILTGLDGSSPVGTTINSFTSVSLSPPMVLICLHERSSVLASIQRSRVFAVNILAEDQADLCRSFTRRETARFNGLATRPGSTGAPLLTDCLAYLDCKVTDVHQGGDHSVVLGSVIDAGQLRESGPLTFFRSMHPRLESVR